MIKQRSYDDATLTVRTSEATEINRAVKTPVHYNKGIECWDYILSHQLGFLEGNIIKYVTRYRYKNGKEDLLKAREYLDKLITHYGNTGE